MRSRVSGGARRTRGASARSQIDVGGLGSGSAGVTGSIYDSAQLI
jgi:hypothetical protein